MSLSFLDGMQNDEAGRYSVTAFIYEGDLRFEYRNYWGSTSIKKRGGHFVIACVSDGDTVEKIFRRNEHMAMHSLSKFMRDCITKYRTDNLPGDWEWDAEMQDWYDKKTALYYTEKVRGGTKNAAKN